jgi:adrenodoxin-NADP+ reductase
MRLNNAGFHPVDQTLIPESLNSFPRAAKRLVPVLLKGSSLPPEAAPKSWSLDFCLSPTHFASSQSSPSRVAFTHFNKTKLDSPFSPDSRVTNTEDKVSIPSSVVFSSIGYKSAPLLEFSDLGIPFDDGRGVVSNDGSGRVVHETQGPDSMQTRTHISGLYCAGWVKRGPTGVIASTMEDAFRTAEAIAMDWESKRPFLHGTARDTDVTGWEGVKAEVQPHKLAPVVQWDDWCRIDKAERERGQVRGVEREKFVRTQDMLEVLR